MKSKAITMGRLNKSFMDGKAQSITFCVTEECNLRCKYCYMMEKNAFHRMTLETAKKAVDFFLNMEPEEDSVIWDFIGGEPTLEMELIDQLSDYIKMQMYLRNHPWFDNYVFSIGTNGLLYHTEAVQRYIKKNRKHISIGITIDGTKEKHDLQRVRMDGSGSYDAVANNVQIWQKQFPNATTKVTFSSDDLIYLKDSIIHLWNMGLKIIPANVVFEDVWKEGDDIIYEDQLRQLADYVVEHKLWEDHSVRFFDPVVGFPMGKGAKSRNTCGSGKMFAVDTNGNLFPCIRFLDFCDGSKNPALSSGNLEHGINQQVRDMVRSATIEILNDGECRECPIASGCGSCAGCNYNDSKTHSVFVRTKYHCKMHQAQVRANDYFWDRLAQCVGFVTPRETERFNAYNGAGWRLDGAKYLYFLLGDNAPAYCSYEPKQTATPVMPEDVFLKGLAYAHEHYMIPVFIGDPGAMLPDHEARKTHMQLLDAQEYTCKSSVEAYMPILDAANYTTKTNSPVCLLRFGRADLPPLEDIINTLSTEYQRINLVKKDVGSWDEITIEKYRQILFRLKTSDASQRTSISALDSVDDALYQDCTAGKTEFTLAPNGNFYTCAGYYFDFPDRTIGNLDSGIDMTELELLQRSKSPKCRNCEVKQCTRCSLESLKATSSANIPSNTYCSISKLESALSTKEREAV